jgi:hypothetical protein
LNFTRSEVAVVTPFSTSAGLAMGAGGGGATRVGFQALRCLLSATCSWVAAEQSSSFGLG